MLFARVQRSQRLPQRCCVRRRQGGRRCVVDRCPAPGVCAHTCTEWYRRQQHVASAALLLSFSDQFMWGDHFSRIFSIFRRSRGCLCRSATSPRMLLSTFICSVFLLTFYATPALPGDGAIAIWGASSKCPPPQISNCFFSYLLSHVCCPHIYSRRRTESSSLISLIHLRRTCTAISLMHRRKILVCAAAPVGCEQGAQLQLWDWTSPCVLFSLQTTARLHCVSVSPLDTSMKGLGCDGRCAIFVSCCRAIVGSALS